LFRHRHRQLRKDATCGRSTALLAVVDRTRRPEESNFAADAFEMPRADLCPGDSLCIPDRAARRFLASTAHGGATAVTQLATFTGLPNQSPSDAHMTASSTDG
jgi:hypothetical protein